MIFHIIGWLFWLLSLCLFKDCLHFLLTYCFAIFFIITIRNWILAVIYLFIIRILRLKIVIFLFSLINIIIRFSWKDCFMNRFFLLQNFFAHLIIHYYGMHMGYFRYHLLLLLLLLIIYEMHFIFKKLFILLYCLSFSNCIRI